MSQLLDFISQQLGSEHVDAIASRLGASREQTESAIELALPTLLGAVARQADDEQGANELHQRLQQQDTSILDRLGSLLGDGNDNASTVPQGFGGVGDLLGSVLGNRQQRVENSIGKASGLNASQMGTLMSMLAPMVMGALAKQSTGSGGGIDLGGLTGMLKSERRSMENQASGGLLAGLLDQDGDGDFDLRDIVQLGMKRFFGSQK